MTTPTTHEPLAVTTMSTPVGELTITASRHGVRAVHWGHGADGSRDEAGPEAARILDTAVRQLAEYFDGSRRTFDVPLDPVGTPFQQAAWAVLRTIPYGQTITYGEQARRLGDPNKSRAVGAANGSNPIGIIVPCHRVVGANGKLTGFAGGLENKAWLLRHEQGDQLPL